MKAMFHELRASVTVKSDFPRRREIERRQQVSDPILTPRQESDLDLVKRAQEGDPDAFSFLFYAHKARIYSVCLRMTSNTAEAEDLTQDAFMQVFRKLSTFRGDSALSTWLYRIAVNTVLMHFRKKSLKQISLDEPMNQDAKLVRREYGSKDGRLTGSVDRIALTRAIRELPDGYRTIFLLHEVEGYEHQEIAQLLDCSVGNSKSQLHKAKLRIRELLGHPRMDVEGEDGKNTRRSAAQKRKETAAAASRLNWETMLPDNMRDEPTPIARAMAQFIPTNA
jgi:RNA polymerase sigma-70 factor (ECF subfamily)